MNLFQLFAIIFLLLPFSKSAISNPKWQTNSAAKSSEMDFMQNLFHQMENEKNNGHFSNEANTIIVGYSPKIQGKNVIELCRNNIVKCHIKIDDLKEKHKLKYLGHIVYYGNIWSLVNSRK
jgi:hypothetical protein